MARKLRIFVENTPQHIILKSLDSLLLFKDTTDYETFTLILSELALVHSINIHAYVLQKNYFELVLTPKYSDSLAKFMQSLGRNYVGYYNKRYERKGSIWKGRYKSSLIEEGLYLISVMHFIEQKASTHYKYSSVRHNLHGEKSNIITEHKLYKDRETYKKSYYLKMDIKISNFIDSSLQRQTITGSDDFIKNLEDEIGRTLSVNSRGRPKKTEQIKRKKMYKKLVVLDKQAHATLKVSPLENLLFAKNVTHIPVTLQEFLKVSEIFPVVFSAQENSSLIALTALGGENLAITADGKWIDSYIPAHIGKYPFALASTKDNSEQKIIMIDEEASVVSKSRGRQLFKKNGENSDVLENAITHLVDHEKNINEMKKLAKEIAESGILELRDISVTQNDETQVLVNGFGVVSKKKLQELDKEILNDWEKRGILTLINTHLDSLKNIDMLFKIAYQRQSKA